MMVPAHRLGVCCARGSQRHLLCALPRCGVPPSGALYAERDKLIEPRPLTLCKVATSET